jgi:hypothetical protein
MTKFTEIIYHPNSQKSTIHMHHMTKFSIIVSQGGNASHKEECNNIKNIHGQGGMQKFMDNSFTCSMRNVAILSRTSASNDLSRGLSSGPNVWI